MENRYFKTLSLMCCIFWISSAEERISISKVVGSNVTALHCDNESLDTLKQLTWIRNGNPLVSFEPQSAIHWFPEAYSLRINMSVSENQLYALIIENVQMAHEGNYTCETNTVSGVWEKKWKLIITENEKAKNLDMWIMIPVVCVCSLVFIMILTLIIVQRMCKKPAENNNESPTVEERTEDIYENCLEINGRQQYVRSQPFHNNYRAH